MSRLGLACGQTLILHAVARRLPPIISVPCCSGIARRPPAPKRKRLEDLDWNWKWCRNFSQEDEGPFSTWQRLAVPFLDSRFFTEGPQHEVIFTQPVVRQRIAGTSPPAWAVRAGRAPTPGRDSLPKSTAAASEYLSVCFTGFRRGPMAESRGNGIQMRRRPDSHIDNLLLSLQKYL